MKAWFGKSATKENNWCYDWLPKLDMPGAGYDVLRYFDMMYQGKVNGYFCQGFNPIASFPNKAKVGAALARLEVDGGDGPAGDRDLGVLAQRRRVQRRRHRQHQDHGVPPAHLLLRRGRRLDRQQRPLVAVALEGRRAAGPGASGHRHHGRAVPPPARDVPQGRRGLPRPDPRPRLVLPQARRTGPGRTGPGVQRQGPERPGRPGQRHDPGQGRRAVAGLRPAARRRQHGERLLDLRRLLDPAGQPDGPPRQQRPLRHGPDPRLGLGLAGEPADSLQPRLGRRQRQAVGPGEEAPGVVERQVLGRHRRARLQGRRTAGSRDEPVHHEPRRVARLFAVDKMAEGRSPSTTSRSRRRSG